MNAPDLNAPETLAAYLLVKHLLRAATLSVGGVDLLAPPPGYDGIAWAQMQLAVRSLPAISVAPELH